MKFSKRRRAVPLRPIWTVMVAAILDLSSVLVTKLRQNRLTLKGRTAGQTHTNTQTTNSAENKGPSGLQSGQQAGWFYFLRPDCAPSSERQQFRMPPVRNARRASIAARRCCSSTAAARCCTLVLQYASSERIPFDRRGIAGMANFKIYLLRQFCSNRVEFFTIHGRHRRKNDGPEF